MHPLDQLLEDLLKSVTEKAEKMEKIKRIRISRWVEKLREPVTIPSWKKNRNNYARLLLAQVSSQRLEEPFDKLPKADRLPNLPLWLRMKEKEYSPKPKRSMFSELDEAEIPEIEVEDETRSSKQKGFQRLVHRVDELTQELDDLRVAYQKLKEKNTELEEMVMTYQRKVRMYEDREKDADHSYEGGDEDSRDEVSMSMESQENEGNPEDNHEAAHEITD
eukprot:TRINITY_DN10345_c1_g2_i2.p1 TRINITY_DN10345_c1_g2~~TRINITY_DN10345_c1_g2_i2.p1  ORF type:complete len:220 (+),score=71.59 TRINITY_DN10345_c1_g2_i2:138-797(+)